MVGSDSIQRLFFWITALLVIASWFFTRWIVSGRFGDLLVGKKVGEGVFGVSFKIKGPPGDLETRVNPIKTLTPRFITRTLDKIKKSN